MILAVVLGEGLYNVGMIEQEYKAMPQYAREYLDGQGYNVEAMSEENLQIFYDMLIPAKDEFYQEYLNDEEWRVNALKNLGQALLFAALGAVGVIIGLGQKKQTGEAPEASATTMSSVQPPVEFSRIENSDSDRPSAS